MLSQFLGRGSASGAGSRSFTVCSSFRVTVKMEPRASPGQPGTLGERVERKLGWQGPSPQPSTLYSILITKPKFPNPFRAFGDFLEMLVSQSKCWTSLGAQWLKLRASNTAGAGLILIS